MLANGCLTEVAKHGHGCTDERHGYALTGMACQNACGKALDCGGECCLDKGHAGACECIGDDPGRPGTCPA